MFKKIIINLSLKFSTYRAFLLITHVTFWMPNDLTFHAHLTFFCLSHTFYLNHDIAWLMFLSKTFLFWQEDRLSHHLLKVH